LLATRVDRRVWQRLALMIAGLFALGLAIVRACTQSLTVDETDTYFWFVAKSVEFLWTPFPNNHILNSVLMWVSTHLFGLSSFTLRLPALLGAALYITICYFLCRNITDRFGLQVSVFICLIYNPFVLDFMSAARGYSLANAFLLAAIAIPFWHLRAARPSLPKSCALASLALSLSFAANFSFAFVDFAVCLAITTWAVQQRSEDSIGHILGFCILPGLLFAFLFCGYPIAHWPRSELWYGAHSLREMKGSLVEASLHQPSPRFEHFAWGKAVDFLARFVLLVLGIF